MKPAQNNGGWRCEVKHRETRQDWYYAQPEIYHQAALLRNRRQKALLRMKARAV